MLIPAWKNEKKSKFIKKKTEAETEILLFMNEIADIHPTLAYTHTHIIQVDLNYTVGCDVFTLHSIYGHEQHII